MDDLCAERAAELSQEGRMLLHPPDTQTTQERKCQKLAFNMQEAVIMVAEYHTKIVGGVLLMFEVLCRGRK